MSLEVLTTLLVTLNETNSDLQFGRGEKETSYFQVKKKCQKKEVGWEKGMAKHSKYY